MINLIKHFLSEKNPLVIMRRNNMRKNLENNSPTLLCPNCLGGILFHDLGIRFNSPTINMMMMQKDFVKFVLNLQDFLNGSFEFFEHKTHKCPCAWLRTKSGEQIVVHFTHYHSEQDALEKWYSRSKRIDYSNMFVCLMERDSLTRDEILALGQLSLKGLVVFTSQKYEDIPYALQIKEYEKDGEVGNLLKKNYLNGSRLYERYFDFVKWFNEADGLDYNISNFKL